MFKARLIKSCKLIRGGGRGWGWYNKQVALRSNKNQEKVVSYDCIYKKYVKESPSRPNAFLEISVGGQSIGKVVVELAQDVVPKTVDNFTQLLKNGYKGSNFHQINRQASFVTGGDVVNGNGTGGRGAESKFLKDENFVLQYTERGVLGMTNAGVDTAGSQFFITLDAMPQLNGRNVAFGKVVKGMDVIDKMSLVFQVDGKPVNDIQIMDCGVL